MTTATGHRNAELEEVWARDEEIRLVGTLDPSILVDRAWTLRLTPRDPAPPRSRRVRAIHTFGRARLRFWRTPGPFAVAVSGAAFEATVPVDFLRPPMPVIAAAWDLHLVSAYMGAPVELRPGRYTGVPVRAQAITYPWQRGDGRRAFTVRPVHGPDGALSIEGRRVR
ncbi:hypothetical protein [Spirillospora sp. NPDC047279]|uniref:hypothetical protein n=1 Tax=Spirillospora sp. NPDC047279 TaxID=3155478 RepID=UPI00340512DD